LAIGVVGVTPASAQVRSNGKYASLGDQFYNDPDDDTPHHGLRFSDLEFGIPTDPYLWSADPGWEPHHTPDRYLTDATDQLRTAVPAGTSSSAAAAILRKAGARCKPTSDSQLQCLYHDVETPHGGDDWDSVTWKVNLSLVNGEVSDLTVVREWARQ
jgi:hypothetical protein